MSTTSQQLLSEFIDDWNAGRRPDVRAFLHRLPAGAERDELADQIGRWLEVARVLCVAPLAGIAESAAGFWATVKWLAGKRRVSWVTTPKTTPADRTADAGRAA